jgi:hypothetical protein
VDTVNIGSRARAYPSFIVALREKWPTVIQVKRIRARIRLVSQSGDQIPNNNYSYLVFDLN